MTPTWTEMTLVLLDQILGERFTTSADKIANLRRVERAAKSMADGIERRIHDEDKGN